MTTATFERLDWTGEYNEELYQKTIKREARQFIKLYTRNPVDYYNAHGIMPADDPDFEVNCKKAAEKVVSFYRHQFRVYNKVEL
jgi:hypothetical protein